MNRKSQILAALSAFVNQRPGLEFGNYGDIRLYRQEYRGILKDKHDFETLLSQVSWLDSLTAEDIIEASKSAYSGRLTILESVNDQGKDVVTVEYCTGQYFPTEYRAAACAVLSTALWRYFRDSGAEDYKQVQKMARDNLGRGIASRWFR